MSALVRQLDVLQIVVMPTEVYLNTILLKQRLHMLNELGCAVVMAVGVDGMVANHDLPLRLGPS